VLIIGIYTRQLARSVVPVTCRLNFRRLINGEIGRVGDTALSPEYACAPTWRAQGLDAFPLAVFVARQTKI
jgi:hypothetical protein